MEDLLLESPVAFKIAFAVMVSLDGGIGDMERWRFGGEDRVLDTFGVNLSLMMKRTYHPTFL